MTNVTLEIANNKANDLNWAIYRFLHPLVQEVTFAALFKTAQGLIKPQTCSDPSTPHHGPPSGCLSVPNGSSWLLTSILCFSSLRTAGPCHPFLCGTHPETSLDFPGLCEQLSLLSLWIPS